MPTTIRTPKRTSRSTAVNLACRNARPPTGCFQKVNESGETANLPFPARPGSARSERSEMRTRRRSGLQQSRTSQGLDGGDLTRHRGRPRHLSELPHHARRGQATRNTNDFEAAENAAVRLGASEVSNSWGGRRARAWTAPPSTIPASSSRRRPATAGISTGRRRTPRTRLPWYPASSPHVVAVGGTRLTLAAGHAPGRARPCGTDKARPGAAAA